MLQKKDNPWLGLASYEYKDAYRFFGREKELSELKTAICNNPFTTIYGISGAGKTSLINAGMIPLLEKENYLPVRVRFDHQSKNGYNTQIIQAVKDAVDRVGGEVELMTEFDSKKVGEDEKLWNFLFASKIWSKTNHQLVPVVFIDQFEEIFTMTEDQDKISQFFETINSLQYNTPPKETSKLLEEEQQYIDFNDTAQFRMVFIMREDFLARLEDNSTDIPALRKNRKGIKRMDGHQALEVILCPYPGIVSREVALQILGKVVGKEVRDTETALSRLSVDTSILSLFCSELYQRAVDTNLVVITKELVGQFGDDIIASYYEDTMKLVSNETMEYLEAHLLTYSGFRNTVALEDLVQNGIKPEELKKIAEKRLIRIETLNGTERVEFMHDVLCKVAKEHREARRNERILKKETKKMTIINLRFLVCSLFGMLVLYLGTNGLDGMYHQIPSVIVSFLSLSMIYYLLFNDKFSNHLLKRYIVAGVIALLIVPIDIVVYFLVSGELPIRYLRGVLFYSCDNVKFIASFSVLFIWLVVSFFIERHSKKLGLVFVIKILVFSLFCIFIHLATSLRLLVYLFALFVLSPYRYTKEKNVWWITLLMGFFVLWCLYCWLSINEIGVLAIVLLLVALSVYCFIRYKKQRSFKETLDYCFCFRQYSEYPFFKKAIAVLSLVFVIVLSASVGIRLSDRYTIIGVAFLAPVSYALIKYMFYGSMRPFPKSMPILIIFVLLLASIIGSQYVYGRLIWLVIVWMLSAVLLYVLGPIGGEKPQGNFRNDKLPSLVIWFVAFFCIPILCMGYNVFSLPKYARVYGGGVHNGNSKFSFIEIKDNNGAVGFRDRNSLVVPTEYKTIKPSRNNDYRYYSVDKDLRVSDSYYGQYYPKISFIVTSFDDSCYVWDCAKHLEIESVCTRLLCKYYNDYPSVLTDEDFFAYLKFLRTKKEDKLAQKLIDRRVQDSYVDFQRNRRKEEKNTSIIGDSTEIKRIKEVASLELSNWLDGIVWSFSLSNSDSLYHYYVDSIYVKNYDGFLDYSKLAKYRICARDYKMALSNANEALSRNEKFSCSRLIEALYFNQDFDGALSLLEIKKNEKDIFDTINNIHYVYRYVGDEVWQDMIVYKHLGVLCDTLSQSYFRLEDILEREMAHPYYDNIVTFYFRNKEDAKLQLCTQRYGNGYHVSYFMDDHKVVSPVMKSFTYPDDENIILIVDAVDNKRKYIDLSGDTLRLLPGSYDRAWRFSEGLAAVSVGGKVGIIDKEGNFIISPSYPIPDYYGYGTSSWTKWGLMKYDDIMSRENPRFVDMRFINGLCPMCGENGFFGLIDIKGKWVVEPEYEYIGNPDELGIREVGRYFTIDEPYDPDRRYLKEPYSNSIFRGIRGKLDKNGNSIALDR